MDAPQIPAGPPVSSLTYHGLLLLRRPSDVACHLSGPADPGASRPGPYHWHALPYRASFPSRRLNVCGQPIATTVLARPTGSLQSYRHLWQVVQCVLGTLTELWSTPSLTAKPSKAVPFMIDLVAIR